MLSLTTLAFSGPGADNRLILFDQSDFGAKRGWYVAFENQGPEGTPLPVNTLRLILAVGDGKEWHYAEAKGIALGRHGVVADVASGRSTLRIDGTEVAHLEGEFVPQNAPVVVQRYPDWASAPARYRVGQENFHVAVGIHVAEDTLPSARFALFEKPAEQRFDLGTAPSVEAVATVTIEAASLPKGPLVDAYGQAIGAAVPGLVRSDADLRAAIAPEAAKLKAWTHDPRLDPYGGVKTAPWHEKATGFFRVAKHGAKWSMVSPQGNPLFYTGLCTAPAPKWDVTPTTGREDLFAALPPKGDPWRKGVWGAGDDADYFSPVEWSLRRKYGAGYEAKAAAALKARLAAWGFSGMGKWAEPVAGVPRIVDLSADWPKINRHLDPFDPAARAARASLGRQLTPTKDDPWVVGNSIGNERDETILSEEIDAIRKGPDSPAKAALEGLDAEAARKKYASAYYRFLYETVKAIDPHHLYLGYWVVPGWWQNESDWDLIAPYCDAIGYDRYSDAYAGMEERERRTGKPVLLGEFSYPAWYGGTRATDGTTSLLRRTPTRGRSTQRRCSRRCGTPTASGRCGSSTATSRSPGAAPARGRWRRRASTTRLASWT